MGEEICMRRELRNINFVGGSDFTGMGQVSRLAF